MTLKGRPILSILVVAAILFTLVIPALASDETGAIQFGPDSLSANLSFTEEVTYYDWSLNKAVNMPTVTLNQGESQLVQFTLNVIRNEEKTENFYEAKLDDVTIENIGSGKAQDVTVKAILEEKDKSSDRWTVINEQTETLDIKNKESEIIDSFNAVRFNGKPTTHDYRIRVEATYEGTVISKDLALVFDGLNNPTNISEVDASASLSDVLGTAPTGSNWYILGTYPLPKTLSGSETLQYNVKIENTGLAHNSSFTLTNVASLTEISSNVVRTSTASVNLLTGDLIQNPDPDPDQDDKDEMDYPAAPAVANAILKEKGLDNRFEKGTNKKNGKPEYGNYIAEVAKAMTQEAKFPAYTSGGTWNGTDYVEISNVEAYKTAILNFLNFLTPGKF